MRLAVCAAVAALPCARPQIVRQLATESTEYRVDARSVAVFSVDATEAPVAPECPGTCPDEGYMVCSGTCPIDCYCADGWGMYVDAESLGSPTNLSMAMSDIALDRTTRDVATAYSKFSASSEWSILPFVTLFAHSEDVANSRKRKSSRMVYGLVDLCKFTAAAGGATPVGDRSLECNCDGCRDSCGIAGSRKLRQCAADGDYVATSESAHIDYSGCTYYASSDALSGVAQEASFCCNAVPSAFEEYIGCALAAILQNRYTGLIRFARLAGCLVLYQCNPTAPTLSRLEISAEDTLRFPSGVLLQHNNWRVYRLLCV